MKLPARHKLNYHLWKILVWNTFIFQMEGGTFNERKFNGNENGNKQFNFVSFSFLRKNYKKKVIAIQHFLLLSTKMEHFYYHHYRIAIKNQKIANLNFQFAILLLTSSALPGKLLLILSTNILHSSKRSAEIQTDSQILL